MTDFVSWSLDDGSQVWFESAGTDLVASHDGVPGVVSAGEAAGRLEAIAKSMQQLCASLRTQMAPDELQLEIGVGVSGEVGWFFAKSTAEGNLKVTLTWKSRSA